MKIVIPGGSGHLGRLLSTAFHEKGHRVIVLSRVPQPEPWLTVPWDGKTLDEWAMHIDGADAVINLAGRSVDCRYDDKNRREILESRVLSTRVVGQAIVRAKHPPRVWLQMSTATIYAHRFHAPNDENSGILGGNEPDAPPEWRFSTDVAQAWEREVDLTVVPSTRKVKMRTAMVMSAERGGAFHALLRQVRLGFGRFGNGLQYVSWIHEDDFVRAVQWIIEHDGVKGAVNVAAPYPLPNREFMHVLRKAWGSKSEIPVTGWMLKLGAWLARTEPELVLKSRRVVPERLIDSGFTFLQPRWDRAARDLCARWRGAADTAHQPAPSY